MQHELQEIWQTIHHCLSVQAPEVFHRLQPGATEEQFSQAEAILHLSLPEEVKALYRIHNGCVDMISPPSRSFEEVVEPYKRSTSELFLDRWRFHSLEALCEQWEVLEGEGYPPMEEWPAIDRFLEQEVQEGSIQFLSQAGFYPLHWHHRWLPFMTGQGYYFIDLMPGPKGTIGQILFVPPSRISEGIAHVVARSLSEFFTRIAADLSAGRYVFDDSTGLFLSKEGWLYVRKWYPSELELFWQARKTFTGRNTLPHPEMPTYGLLARGQERLFDEYQSGIRNKLQAIWERVDVVLGQRVPALSHLLRPGATGELFEQAEALLNIRLPDELKQFYSCHNGLGWKNAPVNFSWDPEHVVNGWRVHSLETLCSLWIGLFEVSFLSYWKRKNEVFLEEDMFPSSTRAIQPVFWHPCWLPFMARRYSEKGISSYQHYFIDPVPGPAGHYGQILFVQESSEMHTDSFLQGGKPKRRRSVPQVVAPSLAVFFARFAQDLEAGIYRYDAATGMLWSRAEWEAASKRGDLERYWRNRKLSFSEGHQPPAPGQWDVL